MSRMKLAMFKVLRRRAWMLMAGTALFLGGAVTSPAQGIARAARVVEPIKVVATFSVLGDMAQEVGGEYVQVSTIVGPNGDAHTFEPTPQDVRALAQADVLILNGLDFEGWLPRLLKSSGFKGSQVLASQGVTVRHLGAGEFFASSAERSHDHAAQGLDAPPHAVGDVDPHAWQDLTNGILYARNIAEGLADVDAAHANYFRKRADLYVAQMEKLDTEIKNAFKTIPAGQRTIITSHDAFGYFGRAYGLQFISVTGFSNEAEPTARDVAAIIDLARKKHVVGIFVENITNAKLVEQIAREAKAKIGGTLYSDALAPAGQPAATYLGMFSWNAGQLINILKPATE